MPATTPVAASTPDVERSLTRMVAAACADPFDDATSIEVAFYCVVDALACCCQALQDPACAGMLGPVVPGATMAGGARVPGTSYELDPVQAAFNIGTLIGWHDATDRTFATEGGHLADGLGAILAVADYLSRKSVAECGPPLAVRDVLVAMLRTRHIQHACAARDLLMRHVAATVAAAAVTTELLGGGRAEVMRAASIARVGASEDPGHDDVSRPWRLGDANSRGVRLALIARAERTDAASAAWNESVPAAAPGPNALNRLFLADPTAGARACTRFDASITARFPAAQAAKVRTLPGDRARLERMPVHEFLAFLVRN